MNAEIFSCWRAISLLICSTEGYFLYISDRRIPLDYAFEYDKLDDSKCIVANMPVIVGISFLFQYSIHQDNYLVQVLGSCLKSFAHYLQGFSKSCGLIPFSEYT